MTPKKLPCGHIFHFQCLRSWLERQQSCPTWFVLARLSPRGKGSDRFAFCILAAARCSRTTLRRTSTPTRRQEPLKAARRALVQVHNLCRDSSSPSSRRIPSGGSGGSSDCPHPRRFGRSISSSSQVRKHKAKHKVNLRKAHRSSSNNSSHYPTLAWRGAHHHHPPQCQYQNRRRRCHHHHRPNRRRFTIRRMGGSTSRLSSSLLRCSGGSMGQVRRGSHGAIRDGTRLNSNLHNSSPKRRRGARRACPTRLRHRCPHRTRTPRPRRRPLRQRSRVRKVQTQVLVHLVQAQLRPLLRVSRRSFPAIRGPLRHSPRSGGAKTRPARPPQRQRQTARLAARACLRLRASLAPLNPQRALAYQLRRKARRPRPLPPVPFLSPRPRHRRLPPRARAQAQGSPLPRPHLHPHPRPGALRPRACQRCHR